MQSGVVWERTFDGKFASGIAIGPGGVIHVAGYEEAAGRGWHLRLAGDGSVLGDDLDPIEYRNSFTAVALDAQGNFYFSGSGLRPNESVGINMVRRRNADLTWAWSTLYNPGATATAYFADVAIDSQGRAAVVGRYWAPTSHTVVHRYLPTGTADWMTMHSSPPDNAVSVVVDAADNIYVTGREEVIGSESATVGLIIRYNANGTRPWTSRIQRKSTCTATGSGPINLWGSARDADGNLWVVGKHCDWAHVIRKYAPDTGALLVTADIDAPFNAEGPYAVASNGAGVTVVGRWGPTAQETARPAMVDVSLDGTQMRFWYGAINYYRLVDVAALGGDRIVIGVDEAVAKGAWIARLRAP
jgi:hypothetical protein